jgi:hypothetical protein
MTEDIKPPQPRFRTWGQRIAWLGRMPMRYRVLIGSQILLASLAIRFRMKEIERAELREEAEKRKEGNKEPTSVES